jgi:hypothetical protein
MQYCTSAPAYQNAGWCGFGCKYVGEEGWDHVGQLHEYVEYGFTIFTLKK